MKDLTNRDDINTFVKGLGTTFGIKKLITSLPDFISPDEPVLFLISGTYKDKPSVLILTDRRILFVGRWALQTNSEDFPLSRVSSIELSTGPMTGGIIVYASNQEAKMTGLAKGAAQKFVEMARDQMSRPNENIKQSNIQSEPVASPIESFAPPAEVVEDVPAKLLQLKELYDAGILTEGEYQEKRTSLVALL